MSDSPEPFNTKRYVAQQARLAPVCWALIISIGSLYVVQVLWPPFTHAGLLFGPAVAAGQWWRIISSAFLHGSLFHLGFNLFFLYVLGPQLESVLGAWRFALLYLGALLAGSLAVLWFDWNQATLGASGAVLGLAGALVVATANSGARLTQTPFFGLVVINLLLPLLVPVISFWGHAGGVIGGVLMALVVLPRQRGADSAIRTRASAALAMALLLTMLAAMVLAVRMAVSR